MSSQITPLYPVSGTDTAKVQGIPVSTTDPTGGQILVYNSATLQYEPSSEIIGTSLGSISTQITGQQISAFTNFQLGINATLIYGASVNGVTLTCPDASGTLALAADLAALNASNLTSGTVPLARLSAATTTTAGTVPGIGGFPLTNATNFFSLVHRYRAIPVTAQTWTNAGTLTGSVGGEPGSMRYGGSTGITPLSTLRFYPNNVGNSLQGALHDVNSNSTLNFSARWAFTFQFFTDSQHANATAYFMLGIAIGTAYGAPATKSVGLRVVNGTGVGFAHDGTTLNVSSTIGTFTSFVSNVLTIENMGTGTVNFYLNGVLSVTMNNGPTGMSATSGETFVVAFTNGATATSNRAFILSASALRMN